jgi:hypothetical protein
MAAFLEAIPRRLGEVPVQKGEQFLVGQPAKPPSHSLVAALDGPLERASRTDH